MTERRPSTHVLDASALLAFLNDEPGGDLVQAALSNAVLSSVNWSEVVQKSLARGVVVEGLRVDLAALGLRIEPFSAEDAEQAAELWPRTRSLGLSLGDRACLALSARLRLSVLTGDRGWAALAPDLDVQLIR